MWDPQLGDGNYRTVQPWILNRANIPEKSETNDETGKKDGRGIIIDNQTGVIHIDRFQQNQKQGQCVRILENGVKWEQEYVNGVEKNKIIYDESGKRIMHRPIPKKH